MYRRYFTASRSMGTMLARTFRCVMMTPLGSAVAPEVQMISASVVGGNVTGGSAASVGKDALRGVPVVRLCICG